jgi:hypothetical protein
MVSEKSLSGADEAKLSPLVSTGKGRGSRCRDAIFDMNFSTNKIGIWISQPGLA